MAKHIVPNVCDGVERDIETIANGDQGILNGGLAHAARALAVQLDNDPSATASANCVGELRKVLAELRAQRFVHDFSSGRRQLRMP